MAKKLWKCISRSGKTKTILNPAVDKKKYEKLLKKKNVNIERIMIGSKT